MKQPSKKGKTVETKPRKPRVKGRTVYVGERPKMPLIIAGVFLAGLLTLILAVLFSRPPAEPEARPAAGTNAVIATNPTDAAVVTP